MSDTPEADATGELFIPDRFEALRDRAELDAIVTPVDAALDVFEDQFADLRASGRGAMMIMRGESGAGKSTFLDTFHMFRAGVETQRIPYGESIAESLQAVSPGEAPRILVIEGREALGRVSEAEIEEGLHSINAFVRSPAGKEALVVWPTNNDNIAKQLADTAYTLGGDALLATDEPVYRFSGPDKSTWVDIAERTTAALNAGASLYAMGISEARAAELREDCATIGSYMKKIRADLRRNGREVRRLLATERCRVWTVVISANESEGDVAALTRGGFSFADVDRLMTATGANVVSDLKEDPERLGILGTVLDARIVHIDMVTALAVLRTYGDDKLKAAMKARSMVTSADTTAEDRLKRSELGILLSGSSLGTRKRGPKPGNNTVTALKNIAAIASEDDVSCNRAFGKALKATGLISGYETEKDLGTGMKRRTDLFCAGDDLALRIEFMWRTKVGRADIANYVLGKLANYGRAIGFLR